jgi:hypothetical protein
VEKEAKKLTIAEAAHRSGRSRQMLHKAITEHRTLIAEPIEHDGVVLRWLIDENELERYLANIPEGWRKETHQKKKEQSQVIIGRRGADALRVSTALS